MSILNLNSSDIPNKDETLYKIFFEKSEDEWKSENKEFSFKFENPRKFSKKEYESFDQIYESTELLESTKNFFSYEYKLKNRFIKIIGFYGPFIKEPYKNKLRKIERYNSISTFICVIFIFKYLLKKNTNFKMIYFINLVMIGNLILSYQNYYNLISDYYMELFNFIPQKEVERRILFLETNKL